MQNFVRRTSIGPRLRSPWLLVLAACASGPPVLDRAETATSASDRIDRVEPAAPVSDTIASLSLEEAPSAVARPSCPEPAARARVPASVPIATLAPRWRRARIRTTADRRDGTLLAERPSGRFELVIGEGRRPGEAAVLRSYFPEQVAIDVLTGRVTAARPALIGHAVGVAANTVMTLDPDTTIFGAREVPSGRRGWQGGSPMLGYRVYGGPQSVIEWSGGALSARDPMTGAVRWTRELGEPTAWSTSQFPEPIWLETVGRFFVRTASSLDALDPISGCVAWSVPLAGELAGSVPIAADEQRLVVLETGTRFAVYDTRDGTRLHAFDDPYGGPWYGDRYNGAAILGDAFVAWRPMGGAHAMTLDGEGLWSRESVVWAEAAEDTVFVGTCDHAIHALEASSGNVAWSYFVDGSSDPCHPEWDREWGALVVSGLPGGSGLAVTNERETILFERSGQVWPARTTTIEGTVRVDGRPIAGAHVRAGDQIVVTDAAGRFSAAVTGHGEATVRADAEELSQLTEGWPVRNRARFEDHHGGCSRVFPANGVRIVPLDTTRSRTQVTLTFERGPMPCRPAGH